MLYACKNGPKCCSPRLDIVPASQFAAGHGAVDIPVHRVPVTVVRDIGAAFDAACIEDALRGLYEDAADNACHHFSDAAPRLAAIIDVLNGEPWFVERSLSLTE